MYNVKRSSKKLGILAITTGLLTTLTCATISPKERDLNIKDIPPEVFAISLEKLLKQGDYKDFLKTERVDKTTFQAAVSKSPVLRGTLQGIKNLKPFIQELLVCPKEGNKTTCPQALTLTKSIMEQAVTSAQQESLDDPSLYSQILNNLAPVVFDAIQKVVNQTIEKDDSGFTNDFLYAIGKNIPKEYLPRFSTLLTSILRIRQSSEPKLLFCYAALGIVGLANNTNIPPGLVLEQIDRYVTLTIRHGVYSGTKNIYQAYAALAARKDLDEKTISCFQEKEEDPRWHENKDLREILEKLKNNPSYPKQGTDYKLER